MEVGAEGFAWRLPRLRRRILRATFVGERRGHLVRPQCCPRPLPDVGTRALRGTAADNGATAPRAASAEAREFERAAEAGKGTPAAVLASARRAGGRGC